jgi:hypothetical protein
MAANVIDMAERYAKNRFESRRTARTKGCHWGAGVLRARNEGSRVLFLILLLGVFAVLFFLGPVVLFGVGRGDWGRRRRGTWRLRKLDSAGRWALAARLIKLAVLYQQEPVLANLVAAPLVVRFHPLSGDAIDKLVLKAVPGAAVHLPEGDPLRGGRRGRARPGRTRTKA